MSTPERQPAALEIIYHDKWLVVINKPNGMLVHRTQLAARDEGPFAMQMVRDIVGQHVYPVHRLDRPTSGVLVFAKDSESARAIQVQFEQHLVRKTYWAICRGYCPASGEIDAPLHHEETGVLQLALTRYTRLASLELPMGNARYPTSRFSLVEVSPQSGRMHQIRKHFGKIRHYLIGDTKHGDLHQNRAFEDYTGCTGLLLHAKNLAFTHPHHHQPLAIEAPLPSHFTRLLDDYPWQADLGQASTDQA